jgi:hypothetical protein
VTRYDTRAPFATAASWATFDVHGVLASAPLFRGATFDGRYVYFAPSTASPEVMRYDTQSAFIARDSWSTFDATGLVESGSTFAGAVFDGRYVYLVPNQGKGRDVLRFDAKSPRQMPSLPQFHGWFL